ncbi:hypothetical protein BH11BAC3_BH11BAC3_38700 [soil metagenome]
MKKLYLVAAFLGFVFFSKAQDNSGSNKKQQDIEALKVAFISRELELTPEEAQKFWPVYNQYSNELRGVVQDDQDVIDRDEKVLNLRKKYRDDFTKVLGPQRMNRLYNAEGRFRQILIKAIKNQRLQRNNTNRPLQRKG